ncbi:hypothetical protein QOT17_022744 [Balamuthia mandrillaris]
MEGEKEPLMELRFYRSELPIIQRDLVVLERGVLVQIVGDIICPQLQRRIKRKAQKLPLCVSVPLHIHLHLAVFGAAEREFSSLEEIGNLFGPPPVKTFRLGSYAILQPPLTIARTSNGETRVKVNYCVYNKQNVLLWPEEEADTDESQDEL